MNTGKFNTKRNVMGSRRAIEAAAKAALPKNFLNWMSAARIRDCGEDQVKAIMK